MVVLGQPLETELRNGVGSRRFSRIGALRSPTVLQRVLVLPERHDTRAVAIVIGIATFVRLVGAAGAIHSGEGPDAPSYLAAAHALASYGLVHAAPNLPFWPAGYPIFIALIFDVFGQAVRVVSAVQVLIFAVASWSLYALIRREFGAIPALYALVLLSVSPAFVAAPNEVMYEPLLGAGLVIAADLISRARRSQSGQRLLIGATGGLVLGLASTMQPKALVLVPFAVAWAFTGRRSVALAAVVLIAAAVGPFAVALRTQDTTGHFALSANFGVTARIGLNDHASGGFTYDLQTLEGCKLPPRLFSRDRVGFTNAELFTSNSMLTMCASRWAIHHPARTLWLGLKKALYFWSPMTGPTTHQRQATWGQPFNILRLFPHSLRDSLPFRIVSNVLFNLWTVLVLASIATGVALAWRQGCRIATAALLVPVLCFMAISMVTIGDPRFRLPIAPFYIGLQGIALAAVSQRVASHRGRSTRQAPREAAAAVESLT